MFTCVNAKDNTDPQLHRLDDPSLNSNGLQDTWRDAAYASGAPCALHATFVRSDDASIRRILER